jgi:hypothetical protein
VAYFVPRHPDLARLALCLLSESGAAESVDLTEMSIATLCTWPGLIA